MILGRRCTDLYLSSNRQKVEVVGMLIALLLKIGERARKSKTTRCPGLSVDV